MAEHTAPTPRPEDDSVPAPSSPPTRKRESADARRARILTASVQLFASQGFAETTVRHIADAVGLLSGSLYHHFTSKEAILETVLREFMTDLLSGVHAITNAPIPPSERVAGLVHHSFQLIENRPLEVVLYQNEFVRLSGQPGFEFVADLSAQVEAAWRATLAESEEDGDFAVAIDSDIRYRMMRDAIWTAVRWFDPAAPYDAAGLAEQYLAVFRGHVATSAAI